MDYGEKASNDNLKKQVQSIVDIMNFDIQSNSEKKNIHHERTILTQPHNWIVFGAPGTGKSYKLRKEIIDANVAKENYTRVTFHPAYSYAQFFGSYKPVSVGEKISYRFVPGPFLRMLLKALADDSDNYILIIEEINRAEVAAVFGEVFQLLDRKDGKSEYDIDIPEDLSRYLNDETLHEGLKLNWDKLHNVLQEGKLFLPDNFYIWATMNSADQGVTLLDTAFKRRWTFEYIGINDGEENAAYRVPLDETLDAKYDWQKIRHHINNRMRVISDIAEDRWLGPFFLKKEDFVTEEIFKTVFKSKVLMYLYHDVAKYTKADQLFTKDYASYSELCDDFDENGMGVFVADDKDNGQ